MSEERLPPKKNVGPKIKYDDHLHEYFRKKAREYYWEKKREQQKEK